VVVTAARLPPGAGEAAFSVIRLRPEETAQVRLDEVLGQAPGASLFRRTSSLAANPTTQGVSLRSIAPSGAGRALVTLDGVPQNDPFGGWVIWSQLPPESIEAVTLVRGAGSGPYGAGALTGVVALDERGEGGSADAYLAERGGARAAGAVEGRAGPMRLFGAAAYERSDGYVPVRTGRGVADALTDLESATLTGRVSLPVGPATLSVRANTYAESRGAGLVGANARATGASASATLARAPGREVLGWRLQAWLRESGFENASVAVAPGRTGVTPANDQFETPATGWGLNAAVRRRSRATELEAGVDARRSEGETREKFRFVSGAFTRDRVAGGRASVAGAYAQGTRITGPWLLTGGVRADVWSTTEGRRRERDAATGAVLLDERPEDRDGVTPTGRLGVRRRLGREMDLRAAAYAGFRPPTLNELHRPFRVGNDVTEANAGLEPEQLFGLDFGVSGDGALRWSAGVFFNRLEDAVTNVTVAQGPGAFPRAGFIPAGGVLRERRNAGVVVAVGLEAEVERDWGRRLGVRAALAITDAWVDGGMEAPQLTGKRPTQAPVWTATAGLMARPAADLTARLDLRWEGARFEDDLNSRELGPAAQLAGTLEWAVRPGVAAYLAAENLTDAAVETGETADGAEQFGAPRTFRAGVRLRR
jgi:outer membrane receptor protein involved in Fe transport